MPKKLTLNDFITRAEVIHNGKYGYSKFVYNGIDNPSIIICSLHGEFLQTPYKHLIGHGCYVCGKIKQANKFKKPEEKFITESNKIHNNRYTYSRGTYKNGKTPVSITCLDHGKFCQRPDNHLLGKGCPKCGKEKLSSLFRKKESDFKIEARKLKGDLYEYKDSNYQTAHIKINILCKKCGKIFKQTPNNHLSKNEGCPFCGNNISKVEIEFLNILNITEKNRQKYIKPFKVDGIKNNKIFEFLGDYWHGNPQKYTSINTNKTVKKTFGELYLNTLSKFKSLFNKGYAIYYIWESDYKSWLKDTSKPFPIKIFKPTMPI